MVPSVSRIFRYSYITSLLVALAVVPIWLALLFQSSPLPPEKQRTRPPDIVEWLFIFITTTPSVLTCLGFSFCYCWYMRKQEDHRMWHGVLFGAFSGLIFNAITAITVIEQLFDW